MSRQPAVRYLIAGGGPAGTLAAQEIRRHDPEGAIRVVTAEPFRYYNRTLLSKEFLLGADAERIFLKDPAFYDRKRIDLETEARLVSLDLRRRTATLSDGSVQRWEKLLVATGADPMRPAVDGAEADGVCVLRSLADAAALRERAATARRAVCVGGGFIGVEVACALRELGLEVHLAMLEDRVWPALVPDPLGRLFADRLERGGVRLHPGCSLQGFRSSRAAVREVRLSGGLEIPADLVVLGLGVRPAVGWLRGSGVPLERGVRTGPTLETAVPGVYAAGDVAEVTPAGGGPPRLVGHWSNAQQQGRLAGANMAGRLPPSVFDGVSICDTRVFDVEVGFVGEPRPDLPFVLRGSLEEGRFIAFFHDGEKLVGSVHVNRTDAIGAAADVVRSGRGLDRGILAGEAEAAALGQSRGRPDPTDSGSSWAPGGT